MSAPPVSLADLNAHIAGILDRLRALADTAGSNAGLSAVLTPGIGPSVGADLKSRAADLIRQIDEVRSRLEELERRAGQLEVEQRREVVGSESFWAGITSACDEARKTQSPDAARAVLLKSFAEALAAWRLDVCEQLAQDNPVGDAPLAALQNELRKAVAGLRSDDAEPRSAAIAGLNALLAEQPAGMSASPLDDPTRAAVRTVLARLHLTATGDHDAALKCLEEARAAAPQDGRVRAAWADYYRAKNDDSNARDADRHAMSLSPDRPDGYVGMALSCEAQKWWDEAQTWYQQAIEVIRRRAPSNPAGELGQWLAPTPGALWLRLAQALDAGDPGARLAAVEQALRRGIAGASADPEGPAYRLKGELLEALQRPTEAAEAYFLAGNSCYGEKRWDDAAALYRRAIALHPRDVRYHWYLADMLCVLSYTSAPPYVDRDKAQAGLEAWDRGVQLALPDLDHGWVYFTRARIVMSLANLPDADRWERYWEAISFAEQSLQSNPGRTSAWVMLGQLHYALGNDLTALHATETALLADPDDVSANEERLFLLTNINRYADAWVMLSRRSAMSPPDPGLVRAVQAHLILCETPAASRAMAYPEALAAADAAVQAGFNTMWLGIDRARLLRFLDRQDDADAAYRALRSRYDPQDVDNQLTHAWAALMTGDLDAAREITSQRAADRVSGLTATQRYLGFGELLRGNVDAARTHFTRSIEVARTHRDLDAWCVADFESEEVLLLLAGRPQLEPARELVAEFRNRALAAKSRPQPASAHDEMSAWLTASAAAGDAPSWSGIGAQATVARFQIEAHRWDEAEASYRRLLEAPGRYFTAPLGIEQARTGRKLEVGLPESAAGPAAAASKDEETSAGRRVDWQKQRDRYSRRRQWVHRFGPTAMQRRPAISSVVIETAGDLETLVKDAAGGLHPAFALNLAGMRTRLRQELGFTAPSVLVQGLGDDLPPGTYVISVFGVPLVLGNLQLSRVLCRASVDQLTGLGLSGEAAVHPEDGSPCVWVPADYHQQLSQAGLQVWTAAECLTLHLAAVLRRQAPDLVGIEAVSDLLSESAKDIREEILTAPGGLPRFASVIQALLAEEVSVAELATLGRAYLDHIAQPAHEIAETLRSLEVIRPRLPGNVPETPVFRLGPRLSAQLSAGILQSGEAAVLALEPVPTQEALAAVRDVVGPMPSPPPNPRNVVVVEDARLRPFFRKLVELEFPGLRVLSPREVIGLETRGVLALIDLAAKPETAPASKNPKGKG